MSVAATEGSVSSGDTDECFDGKETDKESKKKKNRCAVCRKKVGLTGKSAAMLRTYKITYIIHIKSINGK